MFYLLSCSGSGGFSTFRISPKPWRAQNLSASDPGCQDSKRPKLLPWLFSLGILVLRSTIDQSAWQAATTRGSQNDLIFYPLCDPAPIPCSPVTSGTLLQYPPKTVRPQEAVVPPRCQPIPRLCGGLNFFVMVMDFTWIDSSLSTFELSVLICGYVWMDWQWSHVQKKASLIFHWRGQLSQDNYQLQICCICPPDTLPLGANTPTPILHHTHQLFILFHSYLWSFIYMQWIIFLTFSRHPPQSHTSMRYVSAKLFVRIRMLQWGKKTRLSPRNGFQRHDISWLYMYHIYRPYIMGIHLPPQRIKPYPSPWLLFPGNPGILGIRTVWHKMTMDWTFCRWKWAVGPYHVKRFQTPSYLLITPPPQI